MIAGAKDPRNTWRVRNQVPDLNGPVFTGGGKRRPLFAEGQSEDSPLASSQELQGSRSFNAGDDVRAHVPDSHSVILSGRGEFGSIRAEGDAGRPADMAAKLVDQTPLRQVPDLDPAVGTGRGDAQARAIESHAISGPIQSVNPLRYSTVRQVPDRVTQRSGRTLHAPCIGAEIRATEQTRVALNRGDRGVGATAQVVPLPVAKPRRAFGQKLVSPCRVIGREALIDRDNLLEIMILFHAELTGA